MKFKALAATLTLLATLSPTLLMAQPVPYYSGTNPPLYQEEAAEPEAELPDPEAQIVKDSNGGPSRDRTGRIVCPKPAVSEARPRVDLARMKVKPVGQNPITNANLNQFLFELNKFPRPLHQEMVRRNSWIHIIEGLGVSEDPSWQPIFTNTFDGRPWSEVPGSGGQTVLFVETNTPTRIVVNHLYDNHGSINMVLHERAHALDNLYVEGGMTNTQLWKDALSKSPGISEFLNTICYNQYCSGNDNEAFAELLAYNYACPATQADLLAKHPIIANFFKQLTSTERILVQEKTLLKPARQLIRDRQNEIAAYERSVERRARWEKAEAGRIAREEARAAEAVEAAAIAD